MIGNLDTSATRLLRSLADGAVRTSTRARRGSYAPPTRLAQHLAPDRRRGYVTAAQADALVGFGIATFLAERMSTARNHCFTARASHSLQVLAGHSALAEP